MRNHAEEIIAALESQLSPKASAPAAAVPSPPAQSPQRDAADLLQRLVDALDRADSNRGVFSCTDYHDLRCPLSRANSPAEWKGVWRCECGRLELDNAVAAAQAWLLAEAPASREASDREAEPGAMGQSPASPEETEGA